ncbi:YidH family protein [Microvirga arabica]|uniref:YidH family protein n=1 Tax=Microvirga arabica TaxID=1128671 RepID=A0ABV6YCQ2_9HYPH
MATQPVDEKLKVSAEHAKEAAEQTQEAAEQTQEAAENTQEAAEHTQKAAKTTAKATVQLKDSADRRTELAANRTVFAAERTYAAWVRTGLAALASGIGAQKLLADVVPDWMILSTGSVLILFSAFCFAAAVWRQVFTGSQPPHPDVQRLPPFLLVLFNGFLALVSLAALFGLWFGQTEVN